MESLRQVKFWVPGVPRPQGSKSYLGTTKTGKPRFKESSEDLKSWRDDVRSAALRAGVEPVDKGVPVFMKVLFVMPRPKDHYLPVNRRRSVPELRETAPEYHTGLPDKDKLFRAVGDALKGVAYVDDGQVCRTSEWKVYGPRPGAMITIKTALPRAGSSQLDVNGLSEISEGPDQMDLLEG